VGFELENFLREQDIQVIELKMRGQEGKRVETCRKRSSLAGLNWTAVELR
jgi:hypothetical protein